MFKVIDAFAKKKRMRPTDYGAFFQRGHYTYPAMFETRALKRVLLFLASNVTSHPVLVVDVGTVLMICAVKQLDYDIKCLFYFITCLQNVYRPKFTCCISIQYVFSRDRV